MITGVGKYYLYRHIRLDKDEPFYIGIGTKPKRFSCPKVEFDRGYAGGKYRGKVWNDIVTKTDFEVEIMFETNDYTFLLSKELELINLYGRIINKTGVLANLTEGGSKGAKGLKWSDESRKKLSASKMGIKMNPEVVKKRVETWKRTYKVSEETKLKLSISNKLHPSHQKGIKKVKKQII